MIYISIFTNLIEDWFGTRFGEEGQYNEDNQGHEYWLPRTLGNRFLLWPPPRCKANHPRKPILGVTNIAAPSNSFPLQIRVLGYASHCSDTCTGRHRLSATEFLSQLLKSYTQVGGGDNRLSSNFYPIVTGTSGTRPA